MNVSKPNLNLKSDGLLNTEYFSTNYFLTSLFQKKGILDKAIRIN